MCSSSLPFPLSIANANANAQSNLKMRRAFAEKFSIRYAGVVGSGSCYCSFCFAHRCFHLTSLKSIQRKVFEPGSKREKDPRSNRRCNFTDEY